MNDDIRLVSGIGQHHTGRYGRLYLPITLPEIRQMVDTPPSVEKAQAQWLIPSSLPSRSFAEQEEHGEFWLLWADLDEDPPPLEKLSGFIDEHLGSVDAEIYTSRSATVDRPKSRVLIPLSKPLRGADWLAAQTILCDRMAQHGIEPDRAVCRAAQLCYLPNRGQHYETRFRRNGQHFNALAAWAVEIEAIHEAHRANCAALENERRYRAEQRAAMQAGGTAGTGLIDAFNQAFPVTEILLQAGYRQRGRTFCHPESASGSYSATVRNGRVHSLSSADPLYTGGSGAHDAFSAFTVLFHSGDIRAALTDAGEQWLLIDGEPWNQVKQREFRRREGDTLLATVDVSAITGSVQNV